MKSGLTSPREGPEREGSQLCACLASVECFGFDPQNWNQIPGVVVGACDVLAEDVESGSSLISQPSLLVNLRPVRDTVQRDGTVFLRLPSSIPSSMSTESKMSGVITGRERECGKK